MASRSSYFQSIFTIEDAYVPDFRLRTNKKLDCIDLKEEKDRKHLNQIKKGKSIGLLVGPDNIYPKFLR